MIPRVAFIFTHRIQYFSNLLDELQRRGRIEPVAVYAHDTAAIADSGFDRHISWDNRRDSNFAEVLLPHSTKQTQGGFFSSFNIALARNLDRLKPDCIHLNGYAKAIQWQAWRWARKHKAPILLRGDGDILGRNNGWRPLIRIWPARIFARAAAHVFFQGEENRKYWLARGAAPVKMSWIPCVSDNQVFRKKAFESGVERDAFRAANHADPQDVVFIISGKLKQRKRPADAIEALARCGVENVRLWFLGSGPLQTGLKALAASRKVEGKITWFGFRNQTELPAILQAADVLLHPSGRDPWPYSVLEGAISGLALLLSDKVGSHPDWLEPPPACQVFPCGNTEQLALAIRRFAQDRNLLADLQCSARMKADRHTEREFCNQFENAVFKAMTQGQ